MKSSDIFDLAARNLRESLLRNSLTTMGIAVGVASLVAMLSLGIGLQSIASRRLTHSGLFDTILVSSRHEFRGGFEGGHRPESTARRTLDEAARTEIAKLPQVLEVYPEIRFTCQVHFANREALAMASALPMSAAQNEVFEGAPGHFFSGPNAGEVILLTEFAKQLVPVPSSLIGQEITLGYAERQAPDSSEGSVFSLQRRERRLHVVGIVDREPYGGFRGMGGASIFLPLSFADSLNVMQPGDLRGLTSAPEASGRTYANLTVRIATPARVGQVEESIKQMGFGAFSLFDATRNLQRFFAVLDLFLGIFGSLALAVASLGIINTLVMAILERRREIGIMKAIGASDGDIKRLFFAEAAAMGLAGGLLGVLLGWIIGRTINLGTNLYMRHLQMPAEDIWLVPWWLVAGAILFSVAVTLISGLYPAARAAKLDPVQALHYE